MITFLHVTFYRWILYPILVIASYAAGLANAKIRNGLKSRKSVDGVRPWLKSPANTRPVWFHCSSGELEYAKPVIQLLRQRYPDTKILLTYFSPSVEKSAKNFSAVDHALPVPWDHPLALNRFLDHHKPRVLALSRTDTWPELVYLCHARGIPRLLFSATLSSSKSKFTNPLSRVYHRWIYNRLSAILCVSDDDRATFTAMGVEIPLTVTGDTRYDQVFHRLLNPKQLRENLRPRPEEVVFVAGSTWPDDEAVIAPAAAQIMSYGVRMIVAPHEPTPEHLNELEARFRKSGVKCVRYTTALRWEPGQVLLVDCVGILAELYQWAHIALVGNSFRRHAVHSVMEPLACGCVTLFGPFHHNNREALIFKKLSAGTPPIGFAQAVTGAKDFEHRVLSLVNHHSFREMKNRIRDEVKARTGASQRVLSQLEPYLKTENP